MKIWKMKILVMVLFIVLALFLSFTQSVQSDSALPAVGLPAVSIVPEPRVAIHTLRIKCQQGQVDISLVTGEVKFLEGCTPPDAASEFWSIISKSFPLGKQNFVGSKKKEEK